MEATCNRKLTSVLRCGSLKGVAVHDVSSIEHSLVRERKRH